MGPVVDVEFENNDLPFIKDALEVYSEGKRLVMEVAQHIGNNTVRCIMLGASEGLCKDMDVIATGKGIQVPVGKKTLGRLFNVLGETIDGGESLEGEEHWVIHRDPPSFEEQSPVVEMLETGIKVIDLLAPYAKSNRRHLPSMKIILLQSDLFCKTKQHSVIHHPSTSPLSHITQAKISSTQFLQTPHESPHQ